MLIVRELAHLLGVDDGSGPWYLFWSGFGADITELASMGAVAYLFWRKHNCHVLGCWRVGRHPIEGTQYVVCRRHAGAA